MYLTDRSAPVGAGPDQGRRRGIRPRVAPVVLVLGTVSLITDISSEMVTAVLPLYLVTTLGFSPLAFGTLDGVYNGVSALVQLTGGHLADRVRNHKLLAGLGYGLSALCKPLLLLVSSIGALGTVLAVDRTGKGLRTAPRDAMISLSTPLEKQGRAFGVHRAMDTTGAMLGPLAAFLILSAAADGYDAVFGVSACVAVLGVVVLMLFVPGKRAFSAGGAGGEQWSADKPAPVPGARTPEGGAPGAAHDGTASGASGEATPGASRETATGRPPVRVREALALLRLPRLRALAGCAALLGLTTVSDAFVYLLLQRRAGIAEQWFTLLPLGTAVVFLLLAVPVGALADRIGRHTVFLAGHVALLIGYGLLLWAPHTPALPFLVLALHGVFYAATDGVLPAALADIVPEQLRGSGLAIVGTSQALARFCCSLAFGAAWTVWGDGPALAASAIGLLCCAAVAGRVLRPTDATR
ncbi:MFS transporter [Streptomyces sp. SID13726]|uniref:MFS transporter n=1 Tax=Streptomyces sp. SID13726 TaxID=2706058 RepID=UPI0013B7891E|nr:MFS transporter [Streptomyces sp. SID13726]NEA99266.1 MFS transporter [Streptomyces sp. SID13726]